MLLIDARTLGPQPTGIGRYTRNLLRGLAEDQRPDGLPRPRVWVRPDTQLDDAVRDGDRLELVERPGRPTSLDHALAGHAAMRRDGARLVHTPDAFAPLALGHRRPRHLITLHDVIPLALPDALPRSRKQRMFPLWRGWLRRQTRQAAGVVCVSEHARRDIIRHLRVDPDKLHVIPNGLPPTPPPPPPPPESDEDRGAGALRGLGIRPGEPLLLTVGRRDPYKNVAGLVHAFARLRAAWPRDAAGPPPRLVVAGPSDPRYPEPERAAHQHGLGDAVVFTGYVDDATLRALRRRAAGFVTPSRYEGFGLPAVEAMRDGLPVVCGGGGALPEVVGDAALVCDVDDPAALAEALRRVLLEPGLAAQLREQGRRRAERFTLRKMADAHLALYARLYPA
ncbi:MAG: glycosyltransferase family 1 protein [Planctomycetota bacterium]